MLTGRGQFGFGCVLEVGICHVDSIPDCGIEHADLGHRTTTVDSAANLLMSSPPRQFVVELSVQRV